jgi:integrase
VADEPLRLTALLVERGIPATGGRNYGELADPLCPGLRVRTTWPETGGKVTRFYFRYRHRVSRQLKTAPIGRFPGVTLKEARRLVEERLRPLAEQGADVGDVLKAEVVRTHAEQVAAQEAERAARDAQNVRLVPHQVTRFLASEDFGSRAPGTRRGYKRYLEHTATVWKLSTIDDVTKAAVREEFLRMKRTRGPRAAGQWLAASSAFWSWLVDDELTDRHPFRRTGKLRQASAARPSDRWLDDDGIVALLTRLQLLPPDRALALRLMLATGCRPSEILGGDWSELSQEDRTWRLPAARMKDRRRDHLLHVSNYCIARLPARWPKAGPLFPGRRKGDVVKVDALAKQTARLGLPGFSPKVLRATAATHWRALEIQRPRDDGAVLIERIRPEVREAMLHHSEKNPLAAHYLHDDLWPAQVEAWETWGEKLERLEGLVDG